MQNTHIFELQSFFYSNCYNTESQTSIKDKQTKNKQMTRVCLIIKEQGLVCNKEMKKTCRFLF